MMIIMIIALDKGGPSSQLPILTLSTLSHGWQGIALPLIQTGEYRWYLFGLEEKKIIEHHVISSGLGMAIKVFPLSDKIPNVTRNHIRTEFTCKQVEDCDSEHTYWRLFV